MSHKKRTRLAAPASANTAGTRATSSPQTTAKEAGQPAKADTEPSLPKAPTSKATGYRKWAHLPWTSLLTFALCVIFSTVVYGDVFRRAAEANFITTDIGQMSYLTAQPWGWVYWCGRWVLLLFKHLALGAIVLSLILTGTAALTDRLLGVPRRWQGVGSIVPAALVGWMLWRGTNLYYKFEPSLFLIIPIAVLLVLALLCLFRSIILRHQTKRPDVSGLPWGWMIPVLLFAVLTFTARHWNQNEILTARVQMRALHADWDGIIDDALSAKKPSRAIVAYYTIALEQTGQLLERQYDIAFDFPEVRLKKKDGSEEYGLFVADCNLYAGLTNIAYRCNMDHIVINGPNVYALKRMTLCAILNQEPALANKYLDILSHVPGEGKFVSKYTPMVTNRRLVLADDELKRILALAPQDNRYEQNYRSPAFLGYNAGMVKGTDASLETAIAALLYSKELNRAVAYINIYAQKHNGVLPASLEQALAIVANNDPAVANAFAQQIATQQNTIMAFITAAKPIIDERMRLSEGKSEAEKERLKHIYNARLRQELHEDWLGTYIYYYYCENNDQNQIKAKTKAAVN